MEIIIGLAIATLLVVGWAVGNVFAAVFITLGCLLVGGFGIIGMMTNPKSDLGGIVVLVAMVAAVITWLPVIYRRNTQ